MLLQLTFTVNLEIKGDSRRLLLSDTADATERSYQVAACKLYCRLAFNFRLKMKRGKSLTG